MFHELINSLPLNRRDASLMEHIATLASQAGCATLVEATSEPYSPTINERPRKMRLKEFLQLLKRTENL